MIAPCKDCKERKLGCHANCEKYLEFRSHQDSINRIKKTEHENRSYSFESALNRRRKRR